MIAVTNARTSSPGSCTLKKGTRVELVAEPDADTVQLSFAGLVFEMPRGAALQKALEQFYPHNPTNNNGCIFDTAAWQKRRLLPPEEARWLPLPPHADDMRKSLWDPRGFFCIPDNPRISGDDKTAPPADFAWDRTLIIPGRFAFLRIPFILQKKPGICVAAAAVNVVRHLRPEYEITASELFHLFTDDSHGATYEELQAGMNLLGLPSDRLAPRRANLPSTLQRLKNSLDRGLPVLAADGRHMVLITGYDAATKKLFVWNQWGNGKIVNNMPKGHYELQDSDLPIEFINLVFCRKVRFEPADNVKEVLQSLAGASDDLQMHPYLESQFPSEYFLAHAGPERLRAVLRAGRTILVPQGVSVLCVLPGPAGDKDRLSCVTLPGGMKNLRTLASLSGEISSKSGGNFFSAKSALKLAQGGPASLQAREVADIAPIGR